MPLRSRVPGPSPMWTSFFYLDTRTWFGPGKKLVTYTPHADWTTRDYLSGFGYQILGPDQLRGIAGRPYGSASFTNRIASSRTVDIISGVILVVNDYEVFGQVSVADDDQPPGEANDQYTRVAAPRMVDEEA
jgi:hypothetical protein